MAGPAGRRQGYNCDLGTRGFLVAGPVGRRQWLKTTCQEAVFLCKLSLFPFVCVLLDFFPCVCVLAGSCFPYHWDLLWWQAQLGGDRGYNCNLGSRGFLAAGPVTTAIWELEIFWWQAQLEVDRAATVILGSRDFWWQALLESDLAGSCFPYH